ncbi:MAG: cellulase family glycosylhydrolase [Ruminococcus sp.]|uniref:cellulase family glycosylhydrolase n=1 Tax=Ruminococcus sp. TaxID=41978 RepID=UPI001B733D4F|nr:cellulase family glycosylhydrolase [Ruminococcus sp.]MBP5579051.1 cellulase family glycosylhydrolase [Ruminococcus sp.]
MKKYAHAAAAVISAAVLTLTGAAPRFGQTTTTTANAVDTNNDDWLHAEGSRLYDMNGNEVWLTGANWFGLNCIEGAPHYLWSGDCDDLVREVADRGINVIRFPISSELLVSWMKGDPPQLSGGGMQASYNPPEDMDDGNGGIIKAGTYGNINKEFVEADGKTLIDTERSFDIILGKLKKYGIKAFIDVHSPHTDNSGHNYNLWYGKAGITTDLWIESLVWLADKYKDNDTLIAYDLKNEPHGKGPEGEAAAKWDGSKDENNWAYAATRCAEAILDVNPNALILIEGVEQSLSGAQEGDYWGMPDRKTNSPYIGAWWGGNFRGARQNPIKPKQGTSQIVYSPHDYGPSVYDQTWFAKDFTEKTLLDDYWYDTWAYINAEDIAPELIGEWGGHMDGGKNQKWMTLLRDYMINHHINHTFWCLNTNSGDTGGLWKNFSYSINDVSDTSNGTTITWEEDKYALLEKALWQTQKSGKYIGLDHQVALGKNGISLNDFYANYAASEGSNLDGGKTSSGKPVDADKTSATTTTKTEPTTTTTTTSKTTVTSTTTVTTISDVSNRNFGDSNCDGTVDMGDAVLIMQALANPNKYGLNGTDPKHMTEEGAANADVEGGNGLSNNDAQAIQMYLLGKYSKLPVE